MVYRLYKEFGEYIDIESGDDRNLLYFEEVCTKDGINVGWDSFNTLNDAENFYGIRKKTIDESSVSVKPEKVFILNGNKFVKLDSLDINFKDGNYFIVNIDENSSFCIKGLVVGILYNIIIKNTNLDDDIYIYIPNANDICKMNLIEIKKKSYCHLTLVYDGENRIWQII